jgi:ATP-binding cassette subfamily B protein
VNAASALTGVMVEFIHTVLFAVASVIAYWKSLTWFRTCLLIYSGTIFIAVTGFTMVLWTNGNTTSGTVIAAGSVAMLSMMMAGWVNVSLMTIYTNLG